MAESRQLRSRTLRKLPLLPPLLEPLFHMHDVLGSKHNQRAQGEAVSPVKNRADTLAGMATKGTERDIPDAWRDSVAGHLAVWVESQPKGRRTDRALADALGVSNFTYNSLKNRKGPLGLHVLVALRAKLGVTIDELLGLGDVQVVAPPPRDDIEEIRKVLREELAAIRAEKPKEKDPPHAKPLRGRPAHRRGLLE